jgi:hypothetical protein
MAIVAVVIAVNNDQKATAVSNRVMQRDVALRDTVANKLAVAQNFAHPARVFVLTPHVAAIRIVAQMKPAKPMSANAPVEICTKIAAMSCPVNPD